MKQFGVAMMLILFSSIAIKAQIPILLPHVNIIPAFQIAVTCTKTTNLIFPFQIKSVDKGSKDLLVQKASGVNNILQLKAAREYFEETNLSVVTGEGKLYSFIVSYIKQPCQLNFLFAKDSTIIEKNGWNFHPTNNDEVLEADARYILEEPSAVAGIRDKKYGMIMRVGGLYIRDDVMSLQLRFYNTTNIDYDVDMLNFSIRDRKQVKRTASQEIPLETLYSLGNKECIKSDSSQVLVVALPKFTIPDKKWLCVQMREYHGGRHMELKIGNKKIIHAVRLTD